MDDFIKRLEWARDILHPDNLTATPEDKLKAWGYLGELINLLKNE